MKITNINLLLGTLLVQVFHSATGNNNSGVDVFNQTDNNLQSITTTIKPRRRIVPIIFTRRADNNTCASSVEDFPDFFTEKQRKHGAVIIAVLVGVYCFTLLAIVCDNYFLPCVNRICEALNLSPDVAAATFMSMATSAPELFVNVIGTFITQSDIGIGTVIGSSMFNTLGVAALGSLFATAPIQVDWWPVTRDCTIYVVAISLLVVFTWDGYIYWYESIVLFIMYFVYFVVMFSNRKISHFARNIVEKYSRKRHQSQEELQKHEIENGCEDKVNKIFYLEDGRNQSVQFGRYEKSNILEDRSNFKDEKSHNVQLTLVTCIEEPVKYFSKIKENEALGETVEKTEEKNAPCGVKLFTIPKEGCLKKFFFFYSWPIKFMLYCLVPNPKKSPKLFPITFAMCILFIGANSYIVSWMITIIGFTFGIPDAILGLTFLAAGACLPEAMSIVIMSRRGEGAMGVSNALGANTMNILLSLGLPWFIKTAVLDGKGSFIKISAGAVEYTILGLMLVALALFTTLYYNGFKFARKTGIILGIIYLGFLSAAITAEILLFETPSC